jgi:hypothetical protein
MLRFLSGSLFKSSNPIQSPPPEKWNPAAPSTQPPIQHRLCVVSEPDNKLIRMIKSQSNLPDASWADIRIKDKNITLFSLNYYTDKDGSYQKRLDGNHKILFITRNQADLNAHEEAILALTKNRTNAPNIPLSAILIITDIGMRSNLVFSHDFPVVEMQLPNYSPVPELETKAPSPTLTVDTQEKLCELLEMFGRKIPHIIGADAEKELQRFFAPRPSFPRELIPLLGSYIPFIDIIEEEKKPAPTPFKP